LPLENPGLRSKNLSQWIKNRRIRSSDFCLRSSDFGLRSSDCGLRSLDRGLWSLDRGLGLGNRNISSVCYNIRTADRNISSVCYNIWTGNRRIWLGNCNINSVCCNMRNEICSKWGKIGRKQDTGVQQVAIVFYLRPRRVALGCCSQWDAKRSK